MARVRANGIELNYTEHGAGPRNLVLVHGWTGAQTHWNEVVKALPASEFHVYAFDLRGAGQSDRPLDGYSMQNMAADIAEATENLGIARFSFVGHSLGGSIGVQMALRHEDRLQSLVLVTPGPSEGILTVDPQEQFLLGMSGVFGDAETHRDFLIAALTGREVTKETLEYQTQHYSPCATEHVEGCWQGLQENVSGRLGEINTPTLVVAGDRDFICQSNLADAARIPHCGLQVFYRVGHMVPWEVPAQLANLITDFVANGVAATE